MKNIQHIILDVDGVIIGERFPFPSDKIIESLKKIRQSGVTISLCTAKPIFAIEGLIEKAGLDNYHIADGGGSLIDPVNKKNLEENCIDKKILGKLLQKLRKEGIYTEIYTTKEYFIEKKSGGDITEKHKAVLQKSPKGLESFDSFIRENNIVKVMLIVKSESDKIGVGKVFKNFSEDLNLAWGVHPVILPLQFGIITNKGISKGESSRKIIFDYNGSFEDTLAVGDSTSDWDFIQHCKYKGAMGNGHKELKNLVLADENGCIGGNVDEDGILDIFFHFGIKL